MPAAAVTSALNATVLTCNGNEGLILNDMGNTLIKDSITGNVMSLRDGFIPLGMKERGGILYIASYNPQTKEGELGSIPSPVINYTYLVGKVVEQDTFLTDLSPNSLSLNLKINTSIIYLSDQTFHAGDKFIPILNIPNILESSYQRYYQDTNTWADYPYISTVTLRGWYKIKLYAISDNGMEFPLEDVSSTKQLYIDKNGNIVTSDYWFIDSEAISEGIDPEATKIYNYYRTFPNVRAGKLGIKIEPELNNSLEYTENDSYKNNYPSVYYNINNNNNTDIFVVINGLKYTGACGVLPDKIEIIVNGNSDPILYKIDNGQFVQDTLKDFIIGPNSRLKTTTIDNNLFFISNGYFTDESVNVYNYNDASLQYCICAVKIENFLLSVDVLVKLYVKDIDGNYIYYRTDSLPRFTPAEIELGINESRGVSVEQYLNNIEGSFDIKLFNNIGNNDQRCFIYNEPSGHILLYNDSLHVYEDTGESIDDYKKIRTWIYPQYGVRVDNSGKTIFWNNKGAFLAPYLYKECGLTNYFYSVDRFVKCSELPLVKVRENGQDETVPLLLPVAFKENYNLVNIISEHTALREFFTNHENEFGLTPADIVKNCLFAVNLNAVNGDGFSANFEYDWTWQASDSWDPVYYGQDSTAVGFDKFWDRRDTIGEESDAALDVFPDNDLTINYGIGDRDAKLGLINVPAILSKKYLSTYMTYKDFCTEASLPYITWFRTYGRGPSKDTIISNLDIISNDPTHYPYEEDLYEGCINTELLLCPGYFNVDKSFSIRLKLLDYKYPLKYLYKNPIKITLQNLGNKELLYFKSLGYRSYYGAERWRHFGYLYDNLTFKSELTSWEAPVVTPYNASEDLLSEKFKLNDGSILESSVECTVPLESDTYTFNYKLTVASLKKILQRRLIASPQIFLSVNDELKRTYLSDYKIDREFPISGSGFYQNGDKYLLVKSNIVTGTNYLLLNPDYMADDETLIDCNIQGLILKKPEDFGQKNSFCFDEGYLPLVVSTLSDHNILENEGRIINLYDQDNPDDAEYSDWIYVLHINHNGNFVPDSAITFRLTINEKTKDFTGDTVAFYIRDISNPINMKLTYRTGTSGLYIKNIGLYKVTRDETRWASIKDADRLYDDNKNIKQVYPEGDVYILDPEQSNGIVLEASYCFKELYSGSNVIGCLDTTFENFLSLPSHPFQCIAGNYYIDLDRKSVLGATILGDDVYANSIIPNGTTIQHEREQQ